MKADKLTHYLVVGPENCRQPFEDVICGALQAGFSCIQLRSKTLTDKELLICAETVAKIISNLNKSESVLFLINDRVNVVRQARSYGLKVDGVHVGQTDMCPGECRKILGKGAVIGLSAPQSNLLEFLCTADLSCVDYIGVAPLHETETKKDLLCGEDNKTIIPSFDEICAFAKNAPCPVVVGGGVKKEDIPLIAVSPLTGYFVVSAVAGVENPYLSAKELVDSWVKFK